MKRKDELKIDALSGIDDRFVDKVSAKRFELLSRRRRPKWIISSSVAAAVLVAIMVPLLLMLLIKQVPVYEGMTVLENYTGSSQVAFDSEKRGNGFDFLSDKKDNNGNNGNNGDNGNHNGQNKKPVDEIIEEDTSISLEIPEQKMYYANPGQDIYINVHISNPDSFEILSFTLNGKKYSSYMFEDGSDMENLILKVNVGDAKGVIEYTIDAIKYVDGTDIKDVIMEGDRTIKVGVYSEGIQPKISTENEFVGINEMTFNVDLSDKFELIERCGGKAYAFICNEDSVVGIKEIELGDSQIKFENLATGSLYRYGVFAYYDSLDGKGMEKYILFEKEISTQTVVAVGNPAIEQESISFNVVFNELFESKKLSAMTLYLGENKVQEADVSGDIAKKTFTLTKLLSNNEYKLVIAYENLGKTETVEYTFKTLEKATPDFTITETEKTQTSFKFDITVTDVDKVGAITKIELIHGEDVTNVEDLSTRELTGLLSNNDYTVRVTYTYDLNDGVGNQTLVKELTVKTEAKAEPTFTINDLTSDTYTINGSYDQTNVDNTLIDYTVKLFKGEELVTENTDKKIAFDSLNYYTEYTVKITYTFDVNDGKGVQTKTVEQTVKTAPYIKATSVQVHNKKDVYTDGDKATLIISVDNPLDLEFNSVIISGETYKTRDASTSKLIFVDIKDVGDLGNKIIEAVNVTIDGIDYTIILDDELQIDILVIGKISINYREIVNEKFEPIEYATATDKIYLVVDADKLEGNTITELEIGYWHPVEPEEGPDAVGPRFKIFGANEIHRLDDHRIYVELDFLKVGGYSFGEVSLTYTNDYIDNGYVEYTGFADFDTPVVILHSTEPRSIYTIEEFRSMENGYYYQLENDLDFTGITDFYGVPFVGVFDGKGHSVKNILMIGGESYHGLFQNLEGVVSNVNMENFVSIFINGCQDYMYNGAIAASASQCSIIKNCSTDEHCELSGGDRSGGICGDSLGIIMNCVNRADVSSYGYNLAGIAANCIYIEECDNYGEITALGKDDENYPFAISASGRMINCNNYGTINHNSTMCGLYGNAEICYVFITEENSETCHNYGAIYLGGKLIVEAKEESKE